MTTETSTQLCARCQTPVSQDDVVYCRTCGKLHHLACWNVSGICSAPGCTGMEYIRPQAQAAPPPPPTQSYAVPPPQVFGTPITTESAIPGFIYEVSLSTAVSNGWMTFQKNMGMAIVAYLIFSAIYGAICMFNLIPGVGIVAVLFVMPPMVGGGITYALNLVQNRNPDLVLLFSGFQQYGKWLGLSLLLGLIYLGLGIPTCIGALLIMKGAGSFGGQTDYVFIAVGVPIAIAGYVFVIAVAVRWLFVYFLAAEGYGIKDALRRSAEMTVGRRWRLFWISFVIGLLGNVGIIACGVGVLFTIPLAICAFASLYLAVKSESTLSSMP